MDLSSELKSLTGASSEVLACWKLVCSYFPRSPNPIGPTDVVALARSAGIRLLDTDDDSFEGRFAWDDDGNESITMSSTQVAEVRSRFTLAHEIGHWLLRQSLRLGEAGRRFRTVGIPSSEVREEERLASMIASEILLPLDVVRRSSHESISWNLVRKLGRRFNVSRTAVLRRISDVVDTTLVHLNVVPNRFGDLHSQAILDQAVYVIPNVGLTFDRGRARLLRQIPFSELVGKRTTRLAVAGSLGRVIATFDVLSSTLPIPNVDLLTWAVNFR
jgi:Zn-dependent peptidase ImmA (M78 family)